MSNNPQPVLAPAEFSVDKGFFMQTTFSLFINGQAVDGEREAFPVINPATEEAFAHCPAASPEQVDQAVAAAAEAFKTFQYTPDAERKAMLHKIADLIEAHADELAELVTLEQGKPLALAQMEVGGAAAWTRYTADLDIPGGADQPGGACRGGQYRHRRRGNRPCHDLSHRYSENRIHRLHAHRTGHHAQGC